MTDVATLTRPSRRRAPRARRFDRLVDRLAIDIVVGKLPEGALLPNETELGRGLQVSRTSYREAVKFLTAKGLIEARPKHGTRVRPRRDWNLLDPDILRWSLEGGPTRALVRELFEMRRAVEPDAARLAAKRATRADLMVIEQALLDMERHAPLSGPAIEADIAFHEAIFAAAGNRALLCLKDITTVTIRWSQTIKQGLEEDEYRRSLREHRGIYEAIRDGREARAETLAIKLVDDALTATERAMHVDPELV
jgi:GntR family transcriptional regulator, galactonate operon transcriptional repressor